MKIQESSAIALLFAFLVAGLMMSFPANSAGADQPKVSGLLRYHINVKQQQAIRPNSLQLEQIKSLGLEAGEPSSELVFIHFTHKLSPGEIRDMEAMGITLYQNSWIPPVLDHKSGFMLARVPIKTVNDLANKNYVTLLNTAEVAYRPMNDQAVSSIHANDLWSLGYDGTGVIIAVLDSGLDTTHADIPTPLVGVDYSGFPITGTTISNKVTGHGTHVTGSALGRGVYASKYKGAAPGASLIFLKIGNDTTASAQTAAIVAALKAAVDMYHADVITMSYGAWDFYMDGASEESQAVDYAFSRGALVFISAGNRAADDQHYSGNVPANGSTDFIRVNFAGSSLAQASFAFRLAWWDGIGLHRDLNLEIYDSSFNNITTNSSIFNEPESSRGTESALTLYNQTLSDPGPYYLRVVNKSNADQSFHIYAYCVFTFANPDRYYTVGSPANATNAIAVGAYVSRDRWTDWQGNLQGYGETLNNMATFSSQGPRVDGVKKPNIAAPGSAIISALDSNYPTFSGIYAIPNNVIISDNGINDGTQPHHYVVMYGTSMSAPLAAGAAALLLQKYPKWKGHPGSIRSSIELSASNGGTQNNISGYGYLNILAAAKWLENMNLYPIFLPFVIR